MQLSFNNIPTLPSAQNEHTLYFCRLLHETTGISLYLFNEELEIQSSATEWEIYMKNLFLLDCRRDLLPLFHTEDTIPLLLSTPLHLNWILQPLKGTGLVLLLGPVFESDFTNVVFQKKMGFREMSVSSQMTFLKMSKDIPVISSMQFSKYAEMLYCSLYPEDYDRATFRIRTGGTVNTQTKGLSMKDDRVRDIPHSHGSRETELEMLRCIREGIPQTKLLRSTKTTTLGMLAPGDPLRQVKNLTISQIVLVSRAAIEGGMDYERSFSLSDFFIQRLELCESPAEVHAISREVIERYTREVHDARQSGYSPMIHYVLTYIGKQLPEPVSLQELSDILGYDKYYISRLFHKETGKTIQQYVNSAKIALAREWISSTDQSLQEISDRLHYSSPAHFSTAFRKETGMSPSDYRK